MGGFRTRGWFGPPCGVADVNGVLVRIPQPTENRFFQPLSIHDYNNTQELAPQPIGGNVGFPLDIAMKIFWNASTYRIQSSITATIQGTTRSESKDITINWGDISDVRTGSDGQGPYGLRERSGIIQAKEMLCIAQNFSPIGNRPSRFPVHTVYTERPFGFFSADIIFELGARPPLQTLNNRRVLRFPWEFTHNLRTLFGGRNAFQTIRLADANPVSSGIWNLNTPWGSFSLPLYFYVDFFPSSISGSLTITVTAADPEERFA